MRLTEKQKLVLWAVQNNAEASVGAICRMTGSREHTVRDALVRLEEMGVIYPMHPINIYPLGFTEYVVFFALAIKQEKKRRELLRYLIASDRISLMLELGGDYEYGINICARDVDQVSCYLEQLGDNFGEIVAEKAIAVRHLYIGFGRKYLAGRRTKPLVRLGPTQSMATIDEVDHRILKALSRERVISHAKIAAQLGLPASTLHYRLNQLKRQGILLNAIYAITPTLFDMQSFRLLLYVKSLSQNFRVKLEQYCTKHLQVVNMVRTFGAWDYEISVEVERCNVMPAITQEFKHVFGAQLSAVKVLPVFNFLKGCNYPFDSLPR